MNLGPMLTSFLFGWCVVSCICMYLPQTGTFGLVWKWNIYGIPLNGQLIPFFATNPFNELPTTEMLDQNKHNKPAISKNLSTASANGLQLLTSTLPLESDKLASGCHISCMPKHLQTAQGPTHPSILPSLGLRHLRGRNSLKVWYFVQIQIIVGPTKTRSFIFYTPKNIVSSYSVGSETLDANPFDYNTPLPLTRDPQIWPISWVKQRCWLQGSNLRTPAEVCKHKWGLCTWGPQSFGNLNGEPDDQPWDFTGGYSLQINVVLFSLCFPCYRRNFCTSQTPASELLAPSAAMDSSNDSHRHQICSGDRSKALKNPQNNNRMAMICPWFPNGFCVHFHLFHITNQTKTYLRLSLSDQLQDLDPGENLDHANVTKTPWNTTCLSGWWYTYPSEKYESQLGSLFPIYGKIKNVPNHQPVIEFFVG